jgi:hypothetical protein
MPLRSEIRKRPVVNLITTLITRTVGLAEDSHDSDSEITRSDPAWSAIPRRKTATSAILRLLFTRKRLKNRACNNPLRHSQFPGRLRHTIHAAACNAPGLPILSPCPKNLDVLLHNVLYRVRNFRRFSQDDCIVSRNGQGHFGLRSKFASAKSKLQRDLVLTSEADCASQAPGKRSEVSCLSPGATE